MSRTAAPHLETAGPAYAGVFAALHTLCFPHGPVWSQPSFLSALESPGCLALLARLDDEPAGFLLIQKAGEEADLALIAVRPDRRRAGIAGALLCEGVSRLRQSGVQALFLEVAEGNTAALAFYEGQGFRHVGRRAGYYRLNSANSPAQTLTDSNVETGAQDAIIMEYTV